MVNWKKYLIISALGLLPALSMAGAACTYGEAILAFESGNVVRGQALMKMAARDGDIRAHIFLERINKEDRMALLTLPQGDGAQTGN